MKKLVLLLLVIFTLSVAIDLSKTDIKKFRVQEGVIPNNSADVSNQRLPALKVLPELTTPPASENLLVGRREVVGYTTYDWQFNGPVYTWCRTDPIANGIHIGWMASEQASGYTDRNEKYSFYSFASRTWEVLAMNIYSARSGFGGFDYNPITGCWHCVAHQSIGGRLTPVAGRDQSPGGGIFETSTGPTGYLWPPCGVTNNQAIHVACIKEDPVGDYDDTLCYTRVQPWNTWSTPIIIVDPMPQPYGPAHNIFASKTSNKVIITWEQWEHPGGLAAPVDSAYYRISNNGGLTWEPPVLMPFPPAFAGYPENPKPSYHITSLFPMFDSQDNLHIMAAVNAVFYDTLPLVLPAEIWHYCPTNNPAWSLVRRADTDTLTAGGGSNYIWACRPSLVQEPGTNNFYACWEEFDSLPNVDPTSGYNRADVYVAKSFNGGRTWGAPLRLNNRDETSKRYPCIGGVVNDTVIVAYMIDSIAGSVVQNQGRASRNPIVCHRVHKSQIPDPAPGIEDASAIKSYNFNLSPAIPNPSNSATKITYSLPTTAKTDLVIYDVLGRVIKTLVSETKPAGEYSVLWDGRNDMGKKVEAGIYFYTLKTPKKSVTKKLIRTN
ncbi:MAG: T9SS type A sorting domain-containing protein [candidate division WOR-3 bacterium]|nr:T9SS type A sorting domain-containing protein [candidate division WOR-3 bacterium]